MRTVSLFAPDISCDHCRRAIEGALSHLVGIRSVDVDVPAQTVRVGYDANAISLDAIRETLDDEGYPTSEA